MTRLASAALALAAFPAGCGAQRTMHDRFTVDPLSPMVFHRELTASEQCLHCHTGLRSAPAVPHPPYDRCAACLVAGE